MATALDVITKAMRLATILAAGTDPTADEAEDALDSLNDMIAQWQAQGIYTGIGALLLTDDVPVEAKHMKAVKSLLAVDIASMYGGTVPRQVKADAMTGWQLLKADFFDREQLRNENAIAYMPSQRRYWGVSR